MLTYFKKIAEDENKNLQLIYFIKQNNNPISDRSYKHITDQIIAGDGYENFDIRRGVQDATNNMMLRPRQFQLKSKDALRNAGSKIQLYYSYYGIASSCMEAVKNSEAESKRDCGLAVGGMTWNFAQRPIEKIAIKSLKKTAFGRKIVGM